jgi:3-oxoacyl-[acyl-carrier protein] reductase
VIPSQVLTTTTGKLLAGRRALVTGAAQGIGREIARRFAAEGAQVAAVDIDGPANEEIAAEIRAAGGSCQAIKADVADAEQVRRAAAAAGAVDILVNNAASVQGDGRLHEIGEAVWDRLLAVCLKSVYLFSREVLPGMMRRRDGVIVSLSSVNALAGIHLAAYTAAKGGIVSLTRLMARQYGGYGIRVNAICPGTILTESSRAAYDAAPRLRDELRALYPAGRFGEPADIAACALFLASPESRFINGAALVVDGGMTAMYRLASLDPPDADG